MAGSFVVKDPVDLFPPAVRKLQMCMPTLRLLNTGGILNILSLNYQQEQFLTLARLHTTKLGWECARDEEVILQAPVGCTFDAFKWNSMI